MSTIFDDFEFASWASPDFLESTGLSDLDYEGVLTKFETDPSMEAAFALCWQHLDSRLTPSSRSYDDIIHRLLALIAKNKLRIVPDGDLDDTNAVTFVHLAVGNALLLEKVENGQSERFWELLDDALRVIRIRNKIGYELDDDYEFSDLMEKSFALLEELIVCKQFHRCFNERKYMQALDCLKEASKLALDTEDCGWGWRFGGQLFEFMVPAQKAVDAFDEIYEENSENTDWKLLASYCDSLRRIIDDYTMYDESIDTSFAPNAAYNPWDFWDLAHGLASQRLSRDALVDTLKAMQDKEPETRLRLYFFPNTWNSLPDKARGALISADKEYENARGRRQGVFEDLWLATREILVQELLKPYNAFCMGQRDQRELKSFAVLAPIPSEDEDLYDTVQALYYAPLFEEYLRQTFNDADRDFVKGLEKSFGKLNGLRNDAVHANRPAYKRNRFERDIRETYAEFLGIGRNGILPRLMRLHPKDKAKRSARR